MIQDSLLLDSEQAGYLGRLEVGWAIVRLQGRWFTMRKADEHRREARTKTKVSRCVFLRKETADLLRQLRGETIGEFVFDEPDSFYWLVGKSFDALVAELGFEHCTVHDLRKTCNTLMKENGVSIEAAMQVLGHATMQVNLPMFTLP